MSRGMRKPTSCSAVPSSSPSESAHCATLLPFPLSFPSLPFLSSSFFFPFLLPFRFSFSLFLFLFCFFFSPILVSSPLSPRTPYLPLWIFFSLSSLLSFYPSSPRSLFFFFGLNLPFFIFNGGDSSPHMSHSHPSSPT